MFQFLKNLFIKPKYGMGALPSPDDSRNISLASFQSSISPIPDDYESELPPVENQGIIPKCVGSAIHKIAELYLSKEKNWINLSDDDLYEQCKKIDGISHLPGTFPSIGAKVAVNYGIASVDAYNSKDEKIIAKSREVNKLSGYAFVNNEFSAICQAVYQNRAMIASLNISNDWFSGKITKVLTSIGRHCIIINGYNTRQKLLKGRNSWGSAWIGRIAGFLNSNVKAGHFEALYEDYKDNLADLITFTIIPPKLLEDVRNQPFVFTKKMRQGDTGYEVIKLQERLEVNPTGYFGETTKSRVMNFQTRHKLKVDGIVGPATIFELNKRASKLELWCEAIKTHEGWYESSRSYRNLNPGNLKYVGQRRAVGKDRGGFCIFPTYEAGYQELKDLLVRAATAPDNGPYRPLMTLLQFFETYAPASDKNKPEQYAKIVAQKIGVGIDAPISSLIS